MDFYILSPILDKILDKRFPRTHLTVAVDGKELNIALFDDGLELWFLPVKCLATQDSVLHRSRH